MSNKTSEVNSNDAINPSHYSDHPSGIEAIQIIKWMDFCLGNAMKYIWRAGKKDKEKEIEDLEKAIWYINCKIDMLKEEKEKSQKKKRSLVENLERVSYILECGGFNVKKMHKKVLDVYYDFVETLKNGDIVYRDKEIGSKIIVKVHIKNEEGVVSYVDYN